MRGNPLIGSSAIMLVMFALQAACSIQQRNNVPPVPEQRNRDLLTSGSNIGIRKFSLTGVAFFGDRLFAGSDRGLFEIVDGKLSLRFNWFDRDDGIEELFFDRVHDCLWLRHGRIDKLLRFDGKNWSFAPLPATLDSRGERLRGLTMFGSDASLYAASSAGVWQWENSLARWQSIDLPKMNCEGQEPGNEPRCFVAAAASKDLLFAVIRYGTTTSLGSLLPDNADQKLTDRLFFKNGNHWTTVPGSDTTYFFVKKIVSSVDSVYILTSKNELFAAGSEGLTKIPLPGEVETIASTSNGGLIAIVESEGLFEFTTRWEKRSDVNLPGPSGEAHLAEDKGLVVYSVSNVDGRMTGNCTINETAAIWIIKNGVTACVTSQ